MLCARYQVCCCALTRALHTTCDDREIINQIIINSISYLSPILPILFYRMLLQQTPSSSRWTSVCVALGSTVTTSITKHHHTQNRHSTRVHETRRAYLCHRYCTGIVSYFQNFFAPIFWCAKLINYHLKTGHITIKT